MKKEQHHTTDEKPDMYLNYFIINNSNCKTDTSIISWAMILKKICLTVWNIGFYKVIQIYIWSLVCYVALFLLHFVIKNLSKILGSISPSTSNRPFRLTRAIALALPIALTAWFTRALHRPRKNLFRPKKKMMIKNLYYFSFQMFLIIAMQSVLHKERSNKDKFIFPKQDF